MKITPVFTALVMVASVLCSYIFGAFVSVLITVVFLIIFAIRTALYRTLDLVFVLTALSFSVAAASYAYTTSILAHPTVGYMGRYIEADGVIMSNPTESNISENFKYTVRIKEISQDGTARKMRDTVLHTEKICR